MKRFAAVIFSLLSMVISAAGELRLTDATGGAALDALRQAAMELAISGKMDVSMNREMPGEALKKLENGQTDAVIIDHRFSKGKKYLQIPLAAEGLALYISTANPGAELTGKQVREILTSPMPNWKKYNRIDIDIQRINIKLLSPGGTLIRRIFGTAEPDEDIFKVDSMSAGFAFVNTASIFFAPYRMSVPSDIRTMKISGVYPSSRDIISGKYPLSLKYVILCRSRTTQLELLLKHLSQEKYRESMTEAGMLVLLPSNL